MAPSICALPGELGVLLKLKDECWRARSFRIHGHFRGAQGRSILRRRATAFRSLAHRLTRHELRDFEDQAREVLAIASRIESAANQ